MQTEKEKAAAGLIYDANNDPKLPGATNYKPRK